MNKKGKFIFAIFLLLFTSFSAFAQSVEDAEEIDESVEKENILDESPSLKDAKTLDAKKQRDSYPATFETDLTIMAVYPWGAVLEVGETLDVALLRFKNPLTHSNSLKFRGAVKITPITLEADFKSTLTPISFLQFFVGSGLGSGWSFGRYHGFAMNIDRGDGISKKVAINMKDFFFNIRFGATFQFDLGALIDNKWAHLVFLSDQGFKYFGAVNMTMYDSWIYAEDYGENRNSWLYTARYVLGYQMPLPLSFIGIQIETEKKLYKIPENKADWGDDLMYAYITPIIAFKATKYLNILIATQFFTRKNYIYDVNTFYEHNRVQSGKNHYLEFYRMAISCEFTFKH